MLGRIVRQRRHDKKKRNLLWREVQLMKEHHGKDMIAEAMHLFELEGRVQWSHKVVAEKLKLSNKKAYQLIRWGLQREEREND